HTLCPLTTTMAGKSVALSNTIQPDDRASRCHALAKEIARQDRHPLLFVEINTGGEPQKAGVRPEDADRFLLACREDFGLAISGLMCIPPINEPPAPHFALTAKIAGRNQLPLLSM